MWKRHYYHLRRVIINIATACWANLYFWFPLREITVVGITGTDGKTTTATMLAAMMSAGGKKVGLVSTLGAVIVGQAKDTGLHQSTPDTWQLYQLLAQMRDEGVEVVILETTSHALDQRRTWGIPIRLAIVTNITPEHLDYHGTMDAYIAAKARLVRSAGMAVLNMDDPHVRSMSDKSPHLVTYALDRSADYRAESISEGPPTTFKVVERNQRAGATPYCLQLPGRYNIANAVAAIAAATLLGIDEKWRQQGLAEVLGVTGRWEVIQSTPFKVIVDFAHTPNALSQVLLAAQREVCPKGRLIHVFGCAGHRDRQKRAMMGKISGTMADHTIVTMEDPRSESLANINAAIRQGLTEAGKNLDADYTLVDDRGRAISQAIALAHPGDVVIITGKGHEKSLAIGGKEYPWSDGEAVRAGLAGQIFLLPEQK
jgi:UDP-N-acetylmuramoyl-L-alanyl-D-glutamate--2,6-diaminopimelate ligase